MSRFSPFSFIDDRLANLPINDSDKKNFELYNVQRYLSTDKRLSNIVCNFNTTYYYALPKDIQAMAMTAFNGKKLNVRWYFPKVGSNDEKNKNIEKIMMVYDMSYNSVISCLKFGTIDMEKVNDLYTKIYENSTIKFKNKK